MKPFENFGRTNGHNGNGHSFDEEKRPGDIEEEIALTRARMQSTIEAIKKDLSPGQMVDQVLHSVREGKAHDVATTAMHSVGDIVKANPLPAAVIGIGLVWLAASNRSKSASPAPIARAPQRDFDLQPQDVESQGLPPISSAPAFESYDAAGSPESSQSSQSASWSPSSGESQARHAKQRVSHLAHGARAKVHGATSKVSGAAHGAASRAKGVAQKATGKATSGALRARDATVRTYGEQPLVIGAIAVGVGALFGALLPSTQREDQLLGAQRDRVKQRVDAASAEMLGRVKQKVDEGAQRLHEKLEPSASASPSASAAPPASVDATAPAATYAMGQGGQVPAPVTNVTKAANDPSVATTWPQTDEGDFGGP